MIAILLLLLLRVFILAIRWLPSYCYYCCEYSFWSSDDCYPLHCLIAASNHSGHQITACISTIIRRLLLLTISLAMIASIGPPSYIAANNISFLQMIASISTIMLLLLLPTIILVYPCLLAFQNSHIAAIVSNNNSGHKIIACISTIILLLLL